MGKSNDDANEIRRLIEDQIEGVLDSLAPGWLSKSNTAYLTPKSKKDLGSFTVSLDSRNRLPRGAWYRFSQVIGGGSTELVAYLLTGNKEAYREAFEWSRRHFGLEGRREESQDERDARERHVHEQEEIRERQRAQADEAKAKKVEERKHSAMDVWAKTVPLAGTHGEAYLIGRGLPPLKQWKWDCSDTLRFHRSLGHELDYDAPPMPAVVAKVVDAFGDMIAIWQIYLDKDKPIKARVDTPKVGRGPAAGGAVRLGGEGEHIGTAEGVETALGAWFLDGCRYPVWACLSTSGVTSFEPPMFMKRHTGWMDGDKAILKDGKVMEPPGRQAACKLHERLLSVGINSSINDMCRDGDALDLYNTMKKYDRADRQMEEVR